MNAPTANASHVSGIGQQPSATIKQTFQTRADSANNTNS